VSARSLGRITGLVLVGLFLLYLALNVSHIWAPPVP